MESSEPLKTGKAYTVGGFGGSEEKHAKDKKETSVVEEAARAAGGERHTVFENGTDAQDGLSA